MNNIPIVILDEDHVTSTLMRVMLLEISSKVTVSYTVEEAIIHVESTPCIVLIRNNIHTHKHINDVMREIKIISPNSECYLVTANKDPEYHADAIDTGFFDVLTLPYSKRLVIAKVTQGIRLLANIRTLEEQAGEDQLTGILNRREFDNVFPRELNNINEQNQLLSFAMIDVDHFKLYNDTYGHLAGDKVLTLIAQAIKDAVRHPHDFAFRYGGEEFALLLPGIGEEEALRICERVVKHVKDLKIAHTTSKTSNIITLSIGVTTFKGNNKVALIDTEGTIFDIISDADKALYQSKMSGRNKITHTSEIPTKKVKPS